MTASLQRTMSRRAAALLGVLFASTALADGSYIPDPDPLPEGLRVEDCVRGRRLMSASGRVIHLHPPGAGPVELWIGTADSQDGENAATRAMHLVFARFPPGHPEQARCTDLGVLGNWGLTFTEHPPLMAFEVEERLQGGCTFIETTYLIAWSAAERDVTLISRRDKSNAAGRCLSEAELAEGEREEETKRARVRGERQAGLAAFKAGRYAEAEGHFAKIANESPEVLDSWGYALARLGRNAEAERVLLEAVTRAPGQPEAWLTLADVHAALKSPLERVALEQYVKLRRQKKRAVPKSVLRRLEKPSR